MSHTPRTSSQQTWLWSCQELLSLEPSVIMQKLMESSQDSMYQKDMMARFDRKGYLLALHVNCK